MRSAAWALFLGLFCPPMAQLAIADPLLPDLIVAADPTRCYMYCGQMDNELIANKVVYRFIGALPNIGVGPLEIREVTHANNVQDVYQRVKDSNGGMTETLIGSFPDAASIPPRHLFLPGIAQYNLRTVTAGNGLGPVVASNDKTSMAVVDSAVYDSMHPQYDPTRPYRSVSAEILGISVGWADVYPTNLPGQWVEATGLPDGQYWLEVIADPYDRIEELNEDNNTTRILVNLVVPEPQILPGDYNGDDHVDAADYVVWRKTLGGDAEDLGTGADGNGDGRINQPDYAVWQSKFGNSRNGAGSIIDEAPEPSSIVLLAAAIGLMVTRRRRQIA